MIIVLDHFRNAKSISQCLSTQKRRRLKDVDFSHQNHERCDVQNSITQCDIRVIFAVYYDFICIKLIAQQNFLMYEEQSKLSFYVQNTLV